MTLRSALCLQLDSMPPRRESSAALETVAISFCSTDHEQELDELEQRLVLPQHLQLMIQSADKVTIVSDNARAAPLSRWSPLLREERGLPPYSHIVRMAESSGNHPQRNVKDSSKRKNSESRWESMPQPKRISDDSPTFPALAMLRPSEYHRLGLDVVVGIPVQNAEVASPTSSSLSNCSSVRSPGLSIPRRRESFDGGRDQLLGEKEAVSLLSQVLSAIDLSDEGDDDEVSQWIVEASVGMSSSRGRFTLPSASNPCVQPEGRQSSDALNIPVRRQSFDSTDLEGLEDLFSEEDESEHVGDDDDDDE